MKAFHGKQSVKDELLAQLEAHYAADEIIKGVYWENGKGCAVGCTVHSGRHKDYETLYGIPRILARLEDGIFERLPNELSKEFPLQFIRSINVGADLSQIWPKFAVWLLTDPEFGVMKYVKTDDQKSIIQKISDLYESKLPVSEHEWRKIRQKAAAAAADADADVAYTAAPTDATAAYAAAAYAAYAAADVDASAADADAAATDATAAYAAAAAYPYAAAAARKKYQTAQKEKLLALLAACPGEKS